MNPNIDFLGICQLLKALRAVGFSENEIKKIGGKEETRRHLENLGFVVGGKVAVISETDGNMIVNVKEARVAIGKDMANKIMI